MSSDNNNNITPAADDEPADDEYHSATDEIITMDTLNALVKLDETSPS